MLYIYRITLYTSKFTLIPTHVSVCEVAGIQTVCFLEKAGSIKKKLEPWGVLF